MSIFLAIMLLIGAFWLCGMVLGAMFKLFFGLFGAIASLVGGIFALAIGLPLLVLLLPIFLLLLVPILVLWVLAHLFLPVLVVGGVIWLLVRDSGRPVRVRAVG